MSISYQRPTAHTKKKKKKKKTATIKQKIKTNVKLRFTDGMFDRGACLIQEKYEIKKKKKGKKTGLKKRIAFEICPSDVERYTM